jgi:hypothetical protein
MLAIEYYWERAGEALAKADRSSVSECFVSIAMIYQSLAKSEGDLHRRFPKIPPRHIRDKAARSIPIPTRDRRRSTNEAPVPDVARGWAVAGEGFDVAISRVIPQRA